MVPSHVASYSRSALVKRIALDGRSGSIIFSPPPVGQDQRFAHPQEGHDHGAIDSSTGSHHASVSAWQSRCSAGLPLTTARADAIPAYTVTDLGAGLAELSADADGYGVVIAPDGQRTYPFPHSDNRVSDLSSVLPLIPL